MTEIGTSLQGRGRTIGEADISSFAALTGDWHPQHADAVWAAEGPFGQRVAHGMLVLSYAFGLLPIDPDHVVALRAVKSVVFKRPVAIGTTIRPEAEIVGERPLDGDHALVELALRVRDQSGQLLVRGVIEVLWREETHASTNGAPPELDLSPFADGRVLA
jgi:3-hydroxybutyryl-CoA dehydratase